MVKPHACPKEFCFNYCPAGSVYSVGVYENLDSALRALSESEPLTAEQCGSERPCQRWTLKSDDVDYYEPNEPALKKVGLAEDHFVKNES